MYSNGLDGMYTACTKQESNLSMCILYMSWDILHVGNITYGITSNNLPTSPKIALQFLFYIIHLN